MAEKFPYTGEDIDRVTGGRVNSGVLRMWVSEGLLTAGPRAKNIRGGPRTFNSMTVLKAGIMAELRKHGVGLGFAEQGALEFCNVSRALERGEDVEAGDAPLYYVIKPAEGTLTVIPARSADQSFGSVMDQIGPTALIVSVFPLVKGIVEAMDEMDRAKDSAE